MLVFSWFVCGMLYFLLYSYLFCKLVYKEKFNVSLKLLICSALLVLIICFISSNNDLSYIRPYITHLFVFILLISMYQERFIKTLAGFICILIMSFVSEFVFGLIFSVGFKINFELINNNAFIYFIANIGILFILLCLGKIKIIQGICRIIIQWNDEHESRIFSGLIICIITIGTFFLYNNFISILPSSLLLLTNLFCLAVFIFVIGFFKEKINNKKIIYEYDQLLDYVKVYEKILEEKSKNQHEYKNQLVIIRDTAKKEERNKYINNILNVETTEEDSSWLRKLKYIPQGGLKGLIYYKIQIMLKNHISVLVSVSEELNDIKKWKVFGKNLSDISKVIGVYLDNAIEATNDAKEKYITISVYFENSDIVFDITNTYSGEIDISKIDKEGYTTKGTGKGYGLSLVKDIIIKNEKLEQKRIINGQYYTQQLYVKK